MIKVIICGAYGRMGQAIVSIASRDSEVQIVGGVERVDDKYSTTPESRQRLAETLAGSKMMGKVAGNIDDVISLGDVVIDFSAPEATLHNAPLVAKAGKAYVVGTTGLVGDKRAAFVQAVKGISCVLSSNMSLSANVMFDVAERVARALPAYDSEIVEIHHNMKKDSPSGTAQTLAESVQRGKGAGKFVYGRHGLVGQREKGEIGVHAVRGGDVVGDHTVLFLGDGERIELVHRVTSRDAFAQGAVVAAKWLVGNKKPAGLYDMRDVLGLKG